MGQAMVWVRVLALVLMSAGWSAQARDLRSADPFPADHPMVRADDLMNDAVRARTQGRLTISRRAGSEADSESFIVAQVRNGSLDMARVSLGALSVSVPDSVLPTLPFLFRSTHHMRRTLDGSVGRDILASLERQGLVGLCFYDGGTRSFYSRSKPITSAADLKGLKVRVQRYDSWAYFLRALGAEPVAIPRSLLRVALQAGVVDAADGDWASYVADGHQEVAPFYSLTQHAQSPSILIVSHQVWRTLSPADQTILREAARESVFHARSLVDDYEAAARRRAEAAGVRIEQSVDRKSFADALVPLYTVVVQESRVMEIRASQ